MLKIKRRKVREGFREEALRTWARGSFPVRIDLFNQGTEMILI